MSDRLTLATSTGLPFLALAFHVATGLIALAAGFMAIAVRKGGTWHRRSGLAFAYAMVATGITAVGISLYEGKETFTGGVIIVYLVFTAYTTVKPLPGAGRQVDIALMVLAFTLAAWGYTGAFTALGRPGNQIEGVPAGMLFFMTTIVLLGAIGDARMIRAGGIQRNATAGAPSLADVLRPVHRVRLVLPWPDEVHSRADPHRPADRRPGRQPARDAAVLDVASPPEAESARTVDREANGGATAGLKEIGRCGPALD